MATLVCFHAHPDDEVITTGGLMKKASDAGHTVVLVVATRGEQGQVQSGVLDPGEALWQRRVQEVTESAQLLGAEPPIFLGYEDSGMVDEPSNDNPKCFWQADVHEAARRLALILNEVDADILTIYDPNGLYGHPDHIKVHHVGREAAELAGVKTVFEATSNRDEAIADIKALRKRVEDAEGDTSELPDPSGFETFGVAHADLQYVLDVSEHLEHKRAALKLHKTQIGEQSFFLDMTDDEFARLFGREWFAIPGKSATGGPIAVADLPGLEA